ncbi:helix-turn-helix transcriptional regulator [Halobacillus sp. A5]|uniref:helix-turn-helix transcriptional regulator n=1 Tax=Halobacillus sp. A5 TaxID=2880263 RepID=UPI0020A6601C|nr:helix-turn-helix domain-containing protein [Halobacillus sp. A5]MCP3025821.1 helix-turn-helix domain-containing protein [Halobacillus sp. A5]
MNRYELRDIVSRKLKLVRVEAGFTQSQMSTMLGLSKKTLVQIEKGRTLAGWGTAVVVCSLFSESETLTAALKGKPYDVIQKAAFHQ